MAEQDERIFIPFSTKNEGVSILFLVELISLKWNIFNKIHKVGCFSGATNYKNQLAKAKKDPNVSPEDFAKMKETNEALQATLDSENGDPPKFAVEYYVVRQTIDKNGNPGRITVHQFN